MKIPALLIAALLALSGQTPGPSSQAMRHLVYQFGYNAKVADSGPGTGTTTIDIRQAADGGLRINATDRWWNSVQPDRSSSCELYPNGGVTCDERPYFLTGIQAVIVPLLARDYFQALSVQSNATWNESFDIRALFTPSLYVDFADQLTTWKCASTLNSKGTVPNAAPLILIESNGSMKQEGGRYLSLNQKASIIVDPRINAPVFVTALMTPAPQLTVDRYSVQLRLVKY